jgi:hypothetical protein
MNPKYTVDVCKPSTVSKTCKDPSALNSLFSSDTKAQVLLLFDLGTTKSLIKPIQAYTEHVRLYKVTTIGNSLEVNIVGIGHVGGLRDVLQPEPISTPALLSFANYLDAWPNSIP